MIEKHQSAISLAITVLMLCPAVRAQDDRFVVFEGGKHGYINREGKLVIPINLERTIVVAFSDGRARLAEAIKPMPTKVPYLDKSGKLHIFIEHKWGFIDTSGAITAIPQFDAVQDYSEGLAGVAFDTEQTRYDCLHCDPNQLWGFIDKQGKEVIKPQYHSARPFSEGLAAVENDNGQWAT